MELAESFGSTALTATVGEAIKGHENLDNPAVHIAGSHKRCASAGGAQGPARKRASTVRVICSDEGPPSPDCNELGPQPPYRGGGGGSGPVLECGDCVTLAPIFPS